MKKHYRLEVYATNGYCVLMNECEAESTEAAVVQFVKDLINIHDFDEDFDLDAAYASIKALNEGFTVSFSYDYPEIGPAEEMCHFTNIQVTIDD